MFVKKRACFMWSSVYRQWKQGHLLPPLLLQNVKRCKILVAHFQRILQHNKQNWSSRPTSGMNLSGRAGGENRHVLRTQTLISKSGTRKKKKCAWSTRFMCHNLVLAPASEGGKATRGALATNLVSDHCPEYAGNEDRPPSNRWSHHDVGRERDSHKRQQLHAGRANVKTVVSPR